MEYERRRVSRQPGQPRQSRYYELETVPVGKKLIDQFITQSILCILIMGVIFGVKLLGLRSGDDYVGKLKSKITYSPSLNELGQNAKEVADMIIKKVNPTGMDVHRQEELPVIMIDDEIF